VGVLPLTDGIHSAPLTDEAAHGWVFVPDIAQLDFGDLAEGIMGACILGKPEECELADELAGYG
jgi:hypothetical protein